MTAKIPRTCLTTQDLLLSCQILPFLLLALFLGPAARAENDTRTLLILGDSLTAGYGLADPAGQGFPGQLQELIRKNNAPWKVVAAGVSGDTSAGGLRRIDWLLRQKIDLFIVALGGNDGLRGLPTTTTQENLRAILAKAHAKYPAAKLYVAGMQMPPNLGPEYTKAYKEIFPAVARESSAELIPFLLEGVGGVRALNQEDGIHPTAEGHSRIAELLWKQLEGTLGKKTPAP